MMEENVFDRYYEKFVAYQKKLEFQLHQYALDREVDESDSVVQEIKKKLAEIENRKTLLAPKTTLYKNK